MLKHRLNKILFGIFGAIWGISIGGLATSCCSLFLENTDYFLSCLILLLGIVPAIVTGAVQGSKLLLGLTASLTDPSTTCYQRRQKVLITTQIIVTVPTLLYVLHRSPLNPYIPPSDATLLVNFSHNEMALNKLAEMSQKDNRLTSIDKTWTSPDEPQTIGVSSSRIAQYRHLLSSAAITYGLHTNENTGEISFYYWLQGVGTSGRIDKGYVYLPKPPPTLLTNLDNCDDRSGDGHRYYRHIHGNWYIYYAYAFRVKPS